jgi:hypothetical protein
MFVLIFIFTEEAMSLNKAKLNDGFLVVFPAILFSYFYVAQVNLAICYVN